MRKPHKRVLTSDPVAIRYAQGRVHVADPIPWHSRTKVIKCPDCPALFIVDREFPIEQLMASLKKDHKNGNQGNHSDVIWSGQPKAVDCECAMVATNEKSDQ